LHIFEPFYTTRRGRGGTGLGLSITHGIVEDHAGTIDVESVRGLGTKMILNFPVSRADGYEEGRDGQGARS
jgi:signal transduction histidine kinase